MEGGNRDFLPGGKKPGIQHDMHGWNQATKLTKAYS